MRKFRQKLSIETTSWPLIASVGAIAISPLLLLATAQSAFYNLWLAVMMIALWAGSIVVCSLCHALWNASVYTFFGAGGEMGQLGIADPSIWDPERGYAGLVLAVLVAIVLWRWVKPSAISS